MKLYTEEQLKFIYNCYDFNLDQDGCHIIDEDTYFKQKIKELKPIELPSDKEIEEIETNSPYDRIDEYNYGFIDGANWVKQFIINQNK